MGSGLNSSWSSTCLLLFFPQDPGCSIFTCEFANEVSLGASGLKVMYSYSVWTYGSSVHHYVHDFTSLFVLKMEVQGI